MQQAIDQLIEHVRQLDETKMALAGMLSDLSKENQRLRNVVELVNRGSRMAMPPDLVEALEACKPAENGGE